MDRIAKLIRKLTQREREQLQEVITTLLSGDTASLDIKKLKGVDFIFRARVANIRIIFKKEKDDIRILEISRRDDTTYSKY